ncbi:hypothetical protein [Neomegalonema sp.]|uniref:hypothetical protein n=1 Tax=Neomegalonema sp. TaxID=2039713 RepID=UPI002603E47F|nr:hypothetical protein [Neomegalonema sp.]MDD2867985.1 hypothetical protein [Neomegalonema sp.]
MVELWRRLVWIGVIAAAAQPLAPPMAGAQQQTSPTALQSAPDPIPGDYVGLDGAQSMVLAAHPREGGGYALVFRATPGGVVYNIEAERVAAGAVEGAVDWRGGAGVMRVTARGPGVIMTWAPLNAQGEPDRAATQSFAFVRRGVELPGAPRQAPPRRGDKISPAAFLGGYEFWEPSAVEAGYEGLSDVDRDLLRLYPLVQTDVLWKMCGAPEGGEGLPEALRGQSVTCARISEAMEAGQASGRFAAFKAQTAAQRADALKAVECGHGMHRDAECSAAARRTQEIVLSLQSVAGALQALDP